MSSGILKLMNQAPVYLTLFIVGMIFGSYAVATVWRFRAKFIVLDKKGGQPVDEIEFKKLNTLSKTSVAKDYSRCLNCSYRLKWYDMIPLVSWLFLRGKCRVCHKKIGLLEPIAELSLGILFTISFVVWPVPIIGVFGVTLFILWLVTCVILAMIFIYDLKWLEIPTILNYILVGVGVVYSAVSIYHSIDRFSTVVSILGSALILSGLYFLIYIMSNKKWIGFGDILLGLGLALVLADWGLAYICLFAANLVGCIIVLPGLMTKKLKRTSRIPFGPLLIVGFVIAGLFGDKIISSIFLGAF
jgi:prepilin signal peptidase PulO-like enzyme (type II secretory pathway)